MIESIPGEMRRHRGGLGVVVDEEHRRTVGGGDGRGGAVDEVVPPAPVDADDRRVHEDQADAGEVADLELLDEVDAVAPSHAEGVRSAVGDVVVAGEDVARHRRRSEQVGGELPRAVLVALDDVALDDEVAGAPPCQVAQRCGRAADRVVDGARRLDHRGSNPEGGGAEVQVAHGREPEQFLTRR